MRLAKPKPDVELLALFEESGVNVRRTTELLRELLSEYPDSNGVSSEIAACEREGDRIAHDIIHRLAQKSRRRAAFDSADVHALACSLDDIVDFAEEAADQLGTYGVEASMEAAQELADVLVHASAEVGLALRGLHDGVDSGAHLVEVHRLEREADQIVRGAVAALFAHGIDPMVVIRWKDIFESLEAAVDACETAANLLEGIALKRHRRRG